MSIQFDGMYFVLYMMNICDCTRLYKKNTRRSLLFIQSLSINGQMPFVQLIWWNVKNFSLDCKIIYTSICFFCLFYNYIFIEIARVRASLFQINGVKKEPLNLPEPEGPTVSLNEKVYVPVREHPDVSITNILFYLLWLSKLSTKIVLRYLNYPIFS